MSDRSTEHDAAARENDGKRPLPDERECVTRHRTTIGGESIEYTATAGVIHLRNESRKATAAVFYVALTADADERARYLADPAAYSASLNGLSSAERAALTSLDQSAMIALGMHPFVSHAYRRVLERAGILTPDAP